MSRLIFRVAIFTFVLIADPLFGQSASGPSTAKELPSVALPPELERVLRDYERAWRAGDAAALAALFAEDGFVLQSNRPPVRGRAAIQAAYASEGGGPLRLRALAFAAAETIAYIVGGYGYGDQPGDIGKFTLTLRREPGGPWRIYSDMDNQNAAPKPRSAPQAPPGSPPVP